MLYDFRMEGSSGAGSSDTTFIPKINYMSMMFDSDSDCSMEINAMAMKYLKDEQLTQMMKHNARTSSMKGKNKEAQRLAMLKRVLSDDKDSTPNVTTVGMSPNDMTFATKKYLEKHGLLNDTNVNCNQSDSSLEEPYQMKVNYSMMTTQSSDNPSHRTRNIASDSRNNSHNRTPQSHTSVPNNSKPVTQMDYRQADHLDPGINFTTEEVRNRMQNVPSVDNAKHMNLNAFPAAFKQPQVPDETQTPGRNFKTVSKTGNKQPNSNMYHTPVRQRPANADPLDFKNLCRDAQQQYEHRQAQGRAKSSPVREKTANGASERPSPRDLPHPQQEYEENDNILDITRLKMLPKLL